MENIEKRKDHNQHAFENALLKANVIV